MELQKSQFEAFTEDIEHQVSTLLIEASPQKTEPAFILDLQVFSKKSFWSTDLGDQSEIREQARRKAKVVAR